MQDLPPVFLNRRPGEDAIGKSPAAQARAMVARLTQAERAVLLGVVAGESTVMTARRLGMELPVAEDYRRTMMAKLGADTTCDAVRVGLYAELDPTRRPAPARQALEAPASSARHQPLLGE
jgi:DNA-binding CsgD family transcriptional regulator